MPIDEKDISITNNDDCERAISKLLNYLENEKYNVDSFYDDVESLHSVLSVYEFIYTQPVVRSCIYSQRDRIKGNKEWQRIIRSVLIERYGFFFNKNNKRSKYNEFYD